MVIAGSFWRKVVVTAVAAVGFVSLYEATMLDSKEAVVAGTVGGEHDDAASGAGRPAVFYGDGLL